MEIFQNTWLWLAVAVVGFGVDVYLQKPGSSRGWRGFFRAVAEMVAVGSVVLSSGGDRWNVLQFVAAIAMVRIACAIYPPAHER